MGISRIRIITTTHPKQLHKYMTLMKHTKVFLIVKLKIILYQKKEPAIIA